MGKGYSKPDFQHSGNRITGEQNDDGLEKNRADSVFLKNSTQNYEKKKRTKVKTIAGSVITKLNRLSEQKAINLDDIKKAKATAADLQKTCLSDEELAGLDPLHALYVYASNRLDIPAEQIINLPTLKKMRQALADADDIYIPGYPPMSPVTMSYFSCWSMFDLRVRKMKEILKHTLLLLDSRYPVVLILTTLS
jgi:hypothetical protein